MVFQLPKNNHLDFDRRKFSSLVNSRELDCEAGQNSLPRIGIFPAKDNVTAVELTKDEIHNEIELMISFFLQKARSRGKEIPESLARRIADQLENDLLNI